MPDAAARSLRQSVTARWATYAAGLQFEDLPAEVVSVTKTMLADAVGTILGGSVTPNVVLALQAFPLGAGGGCTVGGHGVGATPEQAAFLNAISVRTTDLDDSHATSRTHPSSIVIPAVLAAVEHAGRRSAADLLVAIVVGYDLTARLSKAMGVRAQFDRGFHAAPVCGTVGAAAAAGRAMGLAPDRMASCIALAASQSAGLVTFEDDETHTLNSFHSGMAARNAVAAALLAASGYAPKPDVLTGRRTMLEAFSPVVVVDRLTEGLGSDFEILGASIKRHACCGQTHAAVDGLLALMSDHSLSADAIDAIDVELSHDAVAMVDGTALLTHNVQYVLAVAAHEGRVGMEHFSPAWTSSPELERLAAKVTVRGSDALQARLPQHKGADVCIRANGRVYHRAIPAPRGSPQDPWTTDELRSKFFPLAARALDGNQAAALWSFVHSIDDVPDVQPLFGMLGGDAGEDSPARAVASIQET